MKKCLPCQGIKQLIVAFSWDQRLKTKVGKNIWAEEKVAADYPADLEKCGSKTVGLFCFINTQNRVNTRSLPRSEPRKPSTQL